MEDNNWCYILYNINNEMRMIQHIKEIYELFNDTIPLRADGVFKITNNGYPLYFIESVDKDLHGYPLYCGYMKSNTKVNLEFFYKTTMNHLKLKIPKEQFEKIVIMIDKEQSSYQALNDLKINWLLCIFHIYKTWSEIIPKKVLNKDNIFLLLMHYI